MNVWKMLFRKIIPILAAVAIVAAAVYYIRMAVHLNEKEEQCLASIRNQLEKGTAPESIYLREFEELQSLVEYSLVARSEMLTIAARLKEKADEPLSQP
ncbi:MAG: hypothetical protein P8Z37_06870 [Acidobacteriota bacterium]